MSTQNKYDLVLLGNIIIDEIYLVQKWPTQGTSNNFQSQKFSIGGIGNILEALKLDNLNIFVECCVGNDEHGNVIKKYLIDQQIKFKLHTSDKPTSKALILSSLELNERTSFVNWGCGNEIFSLENKPTKWTHISYLDIISPPDFKQIKRCSDIISADLCLSNPPCEIINLIKLQLQYIDYLFISESEIAAFIINYIDKNELLNFVNNYQLKCLIFHTRKKTIIIKNKQCVEIAASDQIINNSNVLGAGDAYCANFILYNLKYGNDLEKAAEHAHKQATKFVLVKNEKI